MKVLIVINIIVVIVITCACWCSYCRQERLEQLAQKFERKVRFYTINYGNVEMRIIATAFMSFHKSAVIGPAVIQTVVVICQVSVLCYQMLR